MFTHGCRNIVRTKFRPHRWNLRLAPAVLHDVALFEVAIRNAYDRCITQSFAMTLAPVGDDLEDLLEAIGIIR